MTQITTADQVLCLSPEAVASLSSAEIVNAHNLLAEKPVKKFETKAKAECRLNALIKERLAAESEQVDAALRAEDAQQGEADQAEHDAQEDAGLAITTDEAAAIAQDTGSPWHSRGEDATYRSHAPATEHDATTPSADSGEQPIGKIETVEVEATTDGAVIKVNGQVFADYGSVEEANAVAEELRKEVADQPAQASLPALPPAPQRLTKLEAHMLHSIYVSDYHDGAVQPGSYVWVEQLNHNLGNRAQGVITSLVKKGMVVEAGAGSKDDPRTVAFTELGLASYHASNKGNGNGGQSQEPKHRGKRSRHADKHIYIPLPYQGEDKNPRKVGSHGWRNFKLYRDGMTYDEFRAAGGRNMHFQWDLRHGFIVLK